MPERDTLSVSLYLYHISELLLSLIIECNVMRSPADSGVTLCSGGFTGSLAVTLREEPIDSTKPITITPRLNCDIY